MADMILGSAQGAVGSLLGRLTSALSEEAQLLRGVRGDLQFIKDEMESMNGFLLHMAEAADDDAGHVDDHQGLAWMKQVAEVAYSSQNCVDFYVQSLGAGAGAHSGLRRLPQLLWTLPARHRIATKIRELKVRAHEVGERRQRYGVEAPPRSKVNKASSSHAAGDEDHKEQEHATRRALAQKQPDPYESLSLVKWMTEDLGTQQDDPRMLELKENMMKALWVEKVCEQELEAALDDLKKATTRSVNVLDGDDNKGDTSRFAKNAFEDTVMEDAGEETQDPGIKDRELKLMEELRNVRSRREQMEDDINKIQPHISGIRVIALTGDDIKGNNTIRFAKEAFEGPALVDAGGKTQDSDGKDPLLQQLKILEERQQTRKMGKHLKAEAGDLTKQAFEDPVLIDAGKNTQDSGTKDPLLQQQQKQIMEETMQMKMMQQYLEAKADGPKKAFEDQFANKAFEDPRLASSCSLDCKVWIHLGEEYPPGPSRLLWNILEKIAAPVDQLGSRDEWNDQQLVEKLRLHLEGKKFLIVLEDAMDTSIWDGIKPAFRNCSPGSALLVTTPSREVAISFSPHISCTSWELFSGHHQYLADFYLDIALALVNPNPNTKHHLQPVLRSIITDLALQTSNCRLFLCVLSANPNQTIENFRDLQKNLDSNSPSRNMKQVLMFAYNGLSSNCKNCLLYLTIFPEHTTFELSRLLRRWVAEGMITKKGRLSALDEAEHCLNALVDHRFVIPKDTNVKGKVKRFDMDDLTHNLVTKIASNENFFKTNLPPDLAFRLPVSSALQKRQVTRQLHATGLKARWNGCYHFKRSYQIETHGCNATEMFLESLPLSIHLEVLDLEDCKDLKNHHLKNICNHVFQLKYLSLRNTDITELPKQLDKLRYLETLDIRQTKIRAFAKNSPVLPKLKHLLAGHQNDRRIEKSSKMEEPLATVQMPKTIGTMTELQVISRVAVSKSASELIEIGNLLQLRKLGLILQDPQALTHLYYAIRNLSKSLRTLSIWSDNVEMDMGKTPTWFIPPKHLQKLEISGLANGLPQWVEDLRELTKITLHKTLLTSDDIKSLGNLTSLCYLRLRQESCSESTLSFSKHGFQCLKFLVIECSEITNVNFADEATSKLKKIVWSSTGLQSLSGIEQLQSLEELDLLGNFNRNSVQKAIAENKNNPVLNKNRIDA